MGAQLQVQSAWYGFGLLSLIWAGWIELAIECKGLLSISIVFSVTSCFHMAKLVRDRADPAKYADLQKQLPYQAMIVASFAASLLIPLVAIFSMNLEKEK